ncbi:MAG: hypothetical protein IKE42_05545 [Aquamicrobium sp.]|jgi:hypothetical protein|uniref:hypothetical protein n=1 Tax=Mesorhizobium TaxID=68287 RepID=UPI0010130CE5|nr:MULTISPECIES: hypothetical protein [Mesorhizobium]MBR2687296.1 hypothetical protein [Aquamicrobium sp.]QAZ45014.1 hypothetical protein C1M53_20835 [Mesorhizobium sp. Pch-S]
MLTKIKAAALSAFVAFGALAAVPATAQADGIYLNLGSGEPRFGVYAGDRDQRDWRRDRWDRERGWDRRDRGWDRDRPGCSPEWALNKAERMGIWRARIVDVNRRVIKVAGRQDGERTMVVFGRERGCPVLYR